MRLTSTLLFVVCAGMFAAISYALLLVHPRYSIYVLVGDDAGYYFAIARNFCLGHGLSFDRLHETNGFNPLLTALLIGVYKLFVPDLSLLGCYRAGIMVTLIANVLSVGLMLRLVGGFLDPQVFAGNLRRLAFAATTTFFTGFIALKSNYGMDAPLVLLVGLAYLDRVRRHGLIARGALPALFDGLLLALLFLARIDSLPFLVAAFALMAVKALLDVRLVAGIAARAATVVAVVTPYLVWSEAHFGSWLPVSARLKSQFPVLDLGASMSTVLNSSLNPADLASFALAFAIATATAVWFLRGLRHEHPARTLADPQLAVVAVATLYILMRVTYMALFSRLDVQGSYLILAHAYNLFMVMFLAGTWARRGEIPGLSARRIAQLACCVLLLISAVLGAGKARTLMRVWGSTEIGGGGDEFAFSRAIHALTRPADVIYGGAFGLVGFFADRAWINGDGVANTYEYQHALEQGEIKTYLARSRVTHVVFQSMREMIPRDGQLPMMLRSHLNGRMNYYSVADTATVLAWKSQRNGGSTVCLARYFPSSP